MSRWAIFVAATNRPMWVGESLELLEKDLLSLEAHYGVGVYYLASMID